MQEGRRRGVIDTRRFVKIKVIVLVSASSVCDRSIDLCCMPCHAIHYHSLSTTCCPPTS